MTRLDLSIDSDRLRAAFRRAPERLRGELRQTLSRSALEIARSARRHAPKAHSILTNSINSRVTVRDDLAEAIVFAGTDYARMVERGSGPGGRPPVRTLLRWLRVKRIVPHDPDMDQTDLAFALARSIARRGTRRHPFMAPALAENRAQAMTRINDAVERVLRS